MNESEPETEESRGCTDLEVTVLPNGVVNVNRPESDRAHSVYTGSEGSVLRCSCKGHRFHGHCVHASEIERRPLVTASAQAAAADTANPTVVTDGGEPAGENDTGNAEPPENDGENGPGGDLGTVTGCASSERTVDEDETVDNTPL